MMRYALLLYADVEAARAATREEADRELRRYGRIAQALAEEGVLRGGEAFLPASTGSRVTVTGGAIETSEVAASALELSGFFIVECEPDRAVAIAAELPVAQHGQVEIRPLMDFTPQG